jgi:hypothetical protein
MFNTFERDLLANERYLDLLRACAKRQLVEEATRTGNTTGFFTTLFGRGRNVPATRPTAPVTAFRTV